MPLSVAISTERRAFWWTRRTTFRRAIPEAWTDVQPVSRRRRWLRWWLEHPADAPERVARDALRLPGWAWRAMGSRNREAIVEKFAWTEPKPDCERPALPEMKHRRRTYLFPTPKGENISAIEYAAAEDYYKRLDGGDGEALLLLAATLWRERDSDGRAALRRGDWRVPLFDKAEVEARALRLKDAPPEMLMQALLYFIGLKMYVHRVYRTWLFEGEEEEEEEDNPTPDSSPKREGKRGSGPDFGWWGVYQYAAEVGAFGTVKEVYQTPFHEVCVFLVRKRMEAEKMQSTLAKPQRRGDTED